MVSNVLSNEAIASSYHRAESFLHWDSHIASFGDMSLCWNLSSYWAYHNKEEVMWCCSVCVYIYIYAYKESKDPLDMKLCSFNSPQQNFLWNGCCPTSIILWNLDMYGFGSVVWIQKPLFTSCFSLFWNDFLFMKMMIVFTMKDGIRIASLRSRNNNKHKVPKSTFLIISIIQRRVFHLQCLQERGCTNLMSSYYPLQKTINCKRNESWWEGPPK